MKIVKGNRVFEITIGTGIVVIEGGNKAKGILSSLPSNQKQKIIMLKGNIMNGTSTLDAITITDEQYLEIKSLLIEPKPSKEISSITSSISAVERWEYNEKMIAYREKIQGYRISDED